MAGPFLPQFPSEKVEEVHVRGHRVIGLCVALGLITIGAVRPAAAQVAGPQVSLGYQVLHVPHETFPFGLNLDVGGTLRNGLGLVGEVGWATDDQNEPGVSGNLKFVNYGAGPRWHFGSSSGARPYAQLIGGGVHTSANLTVGTSRVVDSDNAFMLQPGAGVMVPVGGAWGVFGQADYRRVFFKGKDDNEGRLAFGVRFGGR